MSKDDKDQAFEDFMKEAFGASAGGSTGGEPQAQPQSRPGDPIFADLEVPADILQAAQQAMQEQNGLHSSAFANPNAQATSPKPSASLPNENSNSLKISRVRFIDNLPRKKSPQPTNPQQAGTLAGAQTNPFPSTLKQPLSVPTQPLEPALPTERQAMPQASQQSNQSTVSNEPHSFRDEIMARLHAEAESYNGSMPEFSTRRPVDLAEDAIRQAPQPIQAQPQPVQTQRQAMPMPEQESDDDTLYTTGTRVMTKSDFLEALGSKSKKNIPTSGSSTQNIDIPGPGARQSNNLSRRADKFTPVTESRSKKNQGYSDYDKDDREARKAQKKPRNQKSNIHVGRSVALALVVLLLVVGGLGYFYVTISLKAVSPNDKSTLVVNIPESTSSQGVAQILKKNQLIKDATVFSLYMKLTGQSNFKSGYYSLNKAMTSTQIAQALEKGGTATSPVVGKITIPEGYTIDQMAVAITINADSKTSAKTPFTSDEFLKQIKDAAFIKSMAAKYPQLFANLPAADSGVKYQLEGYLFPATYSYNAQTTMNDVVEQMIAAMNQTMQPYYSQLAGLNLNVNQFLSLAALVEKEANSEADRKNVADVFLKRLAQNMTLGSNVALLYAEGKLGSNVSTQDDANIDTTLNSPFNLYQNQGTGPGPVVSPSAMSIDAVANHTPNSYYYFLADPTTGTLYFADTQAEQDANMAQYLPATNNSTSASQ